MNTINTQNTDQQSVKATASLIKETIKVDTGRNYKTSQALELAAKIHALPTYNHAEKTKKEEEVSSFRYIVITEKEERITLPTEVDDINEVYIYLEDVLGISPTEAPIIAREDKVEKTVSFLKSLYYSMPKENAMNFWVGQNTAYGEVCVFGLCPEGEDGMDWAEDINMNSKMGACWLYPLPDLLAIYETEKTFPIPDREQEKKQDFADKVVDLISLFDPKADVNYEFIDTAIEDGLTPEEACESWFGEGEFDVSTLIPLTGKIPVKTEGLGSMVERPFIQITDLQWEELKKTGENFLLTQGGLVVTFGGTKEKKSLKPIKEFLDSILKN